MVSLWKLRFFKGYSTLLDPYTWGLGDIWERRCKGDILIGASGWWRWLLPRPRQVSFFRKWRLSGTIGIIGGSQGEGRGG